MRSAVPDETPPGWIGNSINLSNAAVLYRCSRGEMESLNDKLKALQQAAAHNAAKSGSDNVTKQFWLEQEDDAGWGARLRGEVWPHDERGTWFSHFDILSDLVKNYMSDKARKPGTTSVLGIMGGSRGPRRTDTWQRSTTRAGTPAATPTMTTTTTTTSTSTSEPSYPRTTLPHSPWPAMPALPQIPAAPCKSEYSPGTTDRDQSSHQWRPFPASGMRIKDLSVWIVKREKQTCIPFYVLLKEGWDEDEMDEYSVDFGKLVQRIAEKLGFERGQERLMMGPREIGDGMELATAVQALHEHGVHFDLVLRVERSLKHRMDIGSVSENRKKMRSS